MPPPPHPIAKLVYNKSANLTHYLRYTQLFNYLVDAIDVWKGSWSHLSRLISTLLWTRLKAINHACPSPRGGISGRKKSPETMDQFHHNLATKYVLYKDKTWPNTFPRVRKDFKILCSILFSRVYREVKLTLCFSEELVSPGSWS